VYLLYVDESGDPNGWSNQANFVLGAVAIHEGQVFGLTKQLDGIQQKYFPATTIPIPFHAEEISSGHGRFKSFDKVTRQSILHDVYDVIAKMSFPNLVLFAACVDDTALPSIAETLDVVLTDISSRFNIMLVRQFNYGAPNKGLMIVDQAHEDQYRKLVAGFQTKGSKYGLLTHIVDIPYFATRKDTRMLQLADFCAYAVFRYYERKDATYLEMILERFDRRSLRSPPEGLKHITQRPACQCVACSWRRA